jgi:tyrosine-protein phosphatase YwqE
VPRRTKRRQLKQNVTSSLSWDRCGKTFQKNVKKIVAKNVAGHLKNVAKSLKNVAKRLKNVAKRFKKCEKNCGTNCGKTFQKM